MKRVNTVIFALYYLGYRTLSSHTALGIDFKSSGMLVWIMQISFVYL